MLSCLCRKKKHITIAVIGLDGAGKTSLTYLLKNESPFYVTPTYGFMSHSIPVKFKNYEISVFDLGGSSTIRGYWKNYYSEVHGLIFVIDAADHHRFTEVHRQYSLLTKQANLQNKPMLILCNKCDLPSFTPSNIITSHIIEVSNSWQAPYKVVQVSAELETKEALDEGFMFLLRSIHQNYETLNRGIKSSGKVTTLTEQNSAAIRLQKQIITELSDSPSIVSPGKLMKYGENRISVSIDRPSSAPLQYLRKYATEQEQNEVSL